jgi:hypothetical protein
MWDYRAATLLGKRHLAKQPANCPQQFHLT